MYLYVLDVSVAYEYPDFILHMVHDKNFDYSEFRSQVSSCLEQLGDFNLQRVEQDKTDYIVSRGQGKEIYRRDLEKFYKDDIDTQINKYQAETEEWVSKHFNPLLFTWDRELVEKIGAKMCENFGYEIIYENGGLGLTPDYSYDKNLERY